jgi:FlaA1/EpsC-like NDP-sugar epimerase
MIDLKGQRVLIAGGTGSFDEVMVRRVLSNEFGQSESVTVFSRDEAKQHYRRKVGRN